MKTLWNAELAFGLLFIGTGDFRFAIAIAGLLTIDVVIAFYRAWRR